MASQKFYVRTNSKSKKTVPLYLRVIEGKNLDAWIKLPILIDPSTWSNKTGKFKQILKEPTDNILKEIKDTENELTKLDERVKNHLRTSTTRTKESIQSVVDNYFNPPHEQARTLKAYIQKYIDDATSGQKLTFRGSKQFSPNTTKSIKSMQTELDSYQEKLQEKIQAKKRVPYRPEGFPIDFNDVNIDFYNDWIAYFNKKNYSPNTIGKHIKWLKTILKEAKENGVHSNTEFERRAFRATSSEVENVYLNQAELKKIHDLDLSGRPDVEIPRDIFLIGCYTAQRYSDYSRIDKISVLEDGTKVIKLQQQKTGTKVTIPVSPELYDILRRYETSENEITLPHITEQHLNRKIKDVAEEAGITQQIEHHKVKGGLEVLAKTAKNKLITSHTARRSGLSNWYNAGIPSQYLMKLSGHKTEREFLKYLKLSQDDVAKILSKHDYFIGNVLKVAK